MVEAKAKSEKVEWEFKVNLPLFSWFFSCCFLVCFVFFVFEKKEDDNNVSLFSSVVVL
jgi:hypothetical protein